MAAPGSHRTVRSFALGAAAAAAASSLAAAALHRRLLRRPLPQTSGAIPVEGIGGRVQIRRDRWGVPHVEAQGREDLWFGEGFVHAQDRLWQMDFYRRVACGRLAEIAGEEGLAVDRLMRALGLRHAAEREAGSLDAPLRELIDVYCAGVNAGAA